MLASIFLSLSPSKVELLNSFFSIHFMFALFFLFDSERYSPFSPRPILCTLFHFHCLYYILSPRSCVFSIFLSSCTLYIFKFFLENKKSLSGLFLSQMSIPSLIFLSCVMFQETNPLNYLFWELVKFSSSVKFVG